MPPEPSEEEGKYMPKGEAPKAMLSLPLVTISEQVEWQEGAAWGADLGCHPRSRSSLWACPGGMEGRLQRGQRGSQEGGRVA